MNIIIIDNIIQELEKSKRPYEEFLRMPSMSLGMYVHEAGTEVLQQPHTEDEVYYIIEGKGKFNQEG